MTLRKSNILDKISSLIPGYNGYAVRDELRNTDKKLRENLARIVRESESLIITYQNSLINTNDMQSCKEWEISRKSLNTLFSKINNATYGESSFFSKNQLKVEDLEKIYSYDLEISERVSLISKTVEENMNEVLSAVLVKVQIRAIERVLINRFNFINQYK
ncbi:MAG: hypothetical protein ACOYBS_11860 [Flavobacterium sp.]